MQDPVEDTPSEMPLPPPRNATDRTAADASVMQHSLESSKAARSKRSAQELDSNENTNQGDGAGHKRRQTSQVSASCHNCLVVL